jgi:hypothetical protein
MRTFAPARKAADRAYRPVRLLSDNCLARPRSSRRTAEVELAGTLR